MRLMDNFAVWNYTYSGGTWPVFSRADLQRYPKRFMTTDHHRDRVKRLLVERIALAVNKTVDGHRPVFGPDFATSTIKRVVSFVIEPLLPGKSPEFQVNAARTVQLMLDDALEGLQHNNVRNIKASPETINRLISTLQNQLKRFPANLGVFVLGISAALAGLWSVGKSGEAA